MLKYQQTSGVRIYTQERPLLSTPQGGKIALDAILFSLWQQANGRDLKEILESFPSEGASSNAIRAALACLVKAGLLMRPEEDKGRRGQGGKETRGQLVSAVIVGYNSREWFEECLSSLFSQAYLPLEIIVVDNASSDNSVEWLKVNYPGVKLLCLETTRSLAYAINQGVAAAIGAHFLILNPDIRLEPDAVSHMVAVAQSNPLTAAVAAKLKFWWAPGFLNGLGNRVETSDWGTDNALGYLDLGQFDTWSEVPSACFAATLIPRTAWETVGSIDEGFPLYYEDSEWSYRARMLGYTVRLAPQAVVYHAFGSIVPAEENSGLTARKLRWVVYGRLRFAGKLVSFSYLHQFLRNYGLEDLKNFFHALVRLNWSTAQAYLGGWWDFLKNLQPLLQERRALHTRRIRSDEDLFAMQREMPARLVWQGLPELTWDSVVHYYLPLLRSNKTQPMPEFENWLRRPHLLIVSNDVVDTKMAGPGMRYLEMARALSGDLDVTLAIPSETTLEVADVCLVRYWEERPGSLQVLVENSDVALISGYMVEKFPFLQHTQTRLVVDLYDPFILENLHYYVNEPISAQETFNHHALSITNSLACLGDFFICGSDRQRDFWMGMLAANERINPRTFAKDPSLRALIDVVGIGFPNREPHSKPMLRGVHSAFPEDAQIVLWGGGIWDWLDPITLVKAWPQVLAQHPQARLIFLGTRHPNPLVPLIKWLSRRWLLPPRSVKRSGQFSSMNGYPMKNEKHFCVKQILG